MKKTLAILLSLALVICMIPATAFAGAVGSTVEIGETTYNVIFGADTFTYNGAKQVPVVTLTNGGNPATPESITYKKGDVVVTDPKDAGTYDVYATFSTAMGKVGSFTIQPYDLSKVKVLIDNQTDAITPADNFEWSGFANDTVHFYVNDRETTDSSLITLIKNGITVKVAASVGVENKFDVTYTTKAGGNYTGTVMPTFFSKVNSIGSAVLKVNNVITDNTVLDGGEYNGDSRKIRSMFALYPDSSSTTPLKENVDYTLTCPEVQKAGNHTVTIKGMGSYGSTRTLTLSIAKKVANTDTVYYDAIPDQAVSTINSVEPVIRDRKLGVLKLGTDYTLGAASVSGSKGSIKVDFINNYSGTIYAEFNVLSGDNDLTNSIVYYGASNVSSGTLSTSAYMYSGASQPLSSIVVYKNNEDYVAKKALSTSYYTINYEYDDTKTGKTVSTTAPTEAKTYRVYVVGRNGYAGKKLIGTYTIPKYDMQYVTVSVSMASAASVPSVTVKSIYENITFVKDKDYTVYYSTNISNGKVYVSVTPTADGNLTGSSKGGYYPIVAKSIASCSVSFTNGRSSAAYTGSTIPVDVTVKDGYYTTLTKGTHYTVTYKNAAGTKVASIRDAGTYTVVIEGIGAYTGTTSLTFTVIGTDISGYTVTLKDASVNATGYAQTPVITSVKKGYYYSLTSNDYTVSYQDSTGKTVTSMSAPGTYKVVVTGKNGYSGSTYATFRIVGLPQTVTVTQNSYKVYATSDSFKITAKASGDATGFTYTSSNPAVASVSSTGYVTMHKVGRAVITVTTTGMKKYDPASETVEVKVYPKKGYLTKKPWTDGKKYQAKVRWTYQDGATSYQVRYSRDKNFGAKTYKTKTVKAHGKDYTTQSTTLTGLKSKSTYYIKVRAVYKDPVTGDTYYGAWSGWRSVKTK